MSIQHLLGFIGDKKKRYDDMRLPCYCPDCGEIFDMDEAIVEFEKYFDDDYDEVCDGKPRCYECAAKRADADWL